jgi:hypothetical protein
LPVTNGWPVALLLFYQVHAKQQYLITFPFLVKSSSALWDIQKADGGILFIAKGD